jgi:murein DD-endopeptidase MepM/ murein hydrolase activator NlpD
MPFNTYRFNKKTLEFEKIDLGSSKRIIQVLLSFVLAIAILFGTTATLIFTVFDFKTSNMLQVENKRLINQYDKLNKRVTQISSLMENLENNDDNLYRFLLNTKPIPKTIREMGSGGSRKYHEFEDSDYGQLVIEVSEKVDKLSKKVLIQTKSYEELVGLAQKRTDMMKHIPALQPVSTNHSQFTSDFGIRRHPILRRYMMHAGIDFSANIGTLIYAPGDGKVISTKYTPGYGREILINHEYGYVTRFAHLYTIKVKAGQKVKRGDIIGTVGNSGLSTGPHLHYEIIKDGLKVNPIGYFLPDVTPEEYLNIKPLTKDELNAR